MKMIRNEMHFKSIKIKRTKKTKTYLRSQQQKKCDNMETFKTLTNLQL